MKDISQPERVELKAVESEKTEWTVADSIATYNIDRWGVGYFSINEAGNVSISPLRDKDQSFIRTAMIGRRLGKKVILIAEKLEEVRSIVEVSRECGVDPWIGVRVRLAAKGAGKWATSSGESAKFGLSTLELMEAVEY